MVALQLKNIKFPIFYETGLIEKTETPKTLLLNKQRLSKRLPLSTVTLTFSSTSPALLVTFTENMPVISKVALSTFNKDLP